MIRRKFVLMGTGLITLPFFYSAVSLSAPFAWKFAPAHTPQPQAAGPAAILDAKAAAEIVAAAQLEAQRIKTLVQNPEAMNKECEKVLPELKNRLEQLTKRSDALKAASTADQRKELAAWLILAADAALLMLGLTLPVTAPAAILLAVFVPTTKLAVQFLLTDPDMTTGAALIVKYEGSRVAYFGKLIKASTPASGTPAGLFQRFGGSLFSCLSLAYSAYSVYAANEQSNAARLQLEQARNFGAEFIDAYSKIIDNCATLTAVRQLAAFETVTVLQDIKSAIEQGYKVPVSPIA